jgi:hypothetical protein
MVELFPRPLDDSADLHTPSSSFFILFPQALSAAWAMVIHPPLSKDDDVDGRSQDHWFLGFHAVFLMKIQSVYMVFVRSGNLTNQQPRPPSTNLLGGISRWMVMGLKKLDDFSRKMMEPSLQYHDIP